MENVLTLGRACLATLCVVEMLSALGRLRHRDARREAAWMAALLAAFAARLLVPRGSPADVLLPLAVLLCTSGILLAVHQARGTVAVAAAAAVAAACVAAVELAAPGRASRGPVPAAALAALSVPPLVLLALVQRKTGEAADAVLLACAAAWGAAACLETAGAAPGGLSDALAAPLIALLGFMLFEQGYLSPLTSSGYVDRLAAQRRLMRQTYARLLESRNAMVLQDRLIAAGLLALGAAHEFNDVLTAVRATAAHGRSAQGPKEKDACLELVAEHAAEGGAAAVAFLERLGGEGREEVRSLDVRELVDRVVRLARPSWRPAGISIQVTAPAGLRVRGRRGELEQILINLIRNAVDAVAARASTSRSIRVEASERADQIVVSVSDSAGGIAPLAASNLFSVGASGTGSTGIGLYLSRQLALRNNGALVYRSDSGGSFILTIPSEGPEVSDRSC
jgi:signal transduction histidine kinase